MLNQMVENARATTSICKDRKVSMNIPLAKSMLDSARYSRLRNEYEKSYILYLRYVHLVRMLLSSEDAKFNSELLNSMQMEINRNIFNELDEMKEKVRISYLNKLKEVESQNLQLEVRPSAAAMPEDQICAHEHLPNLFAELAHSNTTQNVETCGILFGYSNSQTGKHHINHLVIPRQKGTANSCEMFDEWQLLEFSEKHNCSLIGWIHSHPTQTAFFSSIDMHTQFMYQNLLSLAIGIVLAPKYNECKVFHLTTKGMNEIRECSTINDHHVHEIRESILFKEAKHFYYCSDTIPIECHDFR
ncbi:hypothetical protein SNEBB_001818 [Seison nebaliae]|nr:hypothetical protein SNEBB_001818 [Seison nebaliae]